MTRRGMEVRGRPRPLSGRPAPSTTTRTAVAHSVGTGFACVLRLLPGRGPRRSSRRAHLRRAAHPDREHRARAGAHTDSAPAVVGLPDPGMHVDLRPAHHPRSLPASTCSRPTAFAMTDRTPCQSLADPDLLFGSAPQQRQLRHICVPCPARLACLARALSEGVKAGLGRDDPQRAEEPSPPPPRRDRLARLPHPQHVRSSGKELHTWSPCPPPPTRAQSPKEC